MDNIYELQAEEQQATEEQNLIAIAKQELETLVLPKALQELIISRMEKTDYE